MRTYMHARKKTSFRLKYHPIGQYSRFLADFSPSGTFLASEWYKYHLKVFSRPKSPKIVE